MGNWFELKAATTENLIDQAIYVCLITLATLPASVVQVKELQNRHLQLHTRVSHIYFMKSSKFCTALLSMHWIQ